MPGLDPHPLQSFLDRLTLRSLLTEEERQAVLNLPGRIRNVDPQRDFVRLGDVVDHSCLICSGLAGRFAQTEEGKRAIVALHVPGDMADLHSVVQPKSSSALQALSPVTIFEVPHVALRLIAARYPTLAEAFWRDCMADSSILAEWVVNVARRDAKARVAHLFCEMAVRSRIAPADGEVMFALPMTQTNLADATGLTSVHVNRTLQALRSRGIATFANRSVRIHDWQKMVRAGDFDPAYLHFHPEPQQPLRQVIAADARGFSGSRMKARVE